MRSLARNKQKLHYALLVSRTEIIDADGNKTGEFENTYGNPIEFKANISPARGNADIDIFGANVNYSKTIVTTDMRCPIDENSLLWIDTDPLTQPYNYVVTQVAKSLNVITYAIKEVRVS